MMLRWKFILALVSVACFARVDSEWRVLVNALDLAGLRDGLSFLADLPKNPIIMGITIYCSEANAKELTKKELEASGVSIRHFTAASYPDRSRSRKVKQREKVSWLLESLLATTGAMVTEAKSGKLLSLVFTGSLKFKAAPNFFTLLTSTLNEFDVVLLSKNRGLTTASDYHDLMVLGLQATPTTLEFLKSFAEVYRNHADRKAFSVLEPRPALLEATVRHRQQMTLGYFLPSDFKRHNALGSEAEEGGFSFGSSNNSSSSSSSLLEVFCKDTASEGSRCHMSEPQQWLRRVERHTIPKDFYARVTGNHLKAAEINENLAHGMWDGSLRFFKAFNATTPRLFCWETDTTALQEKRARARIQYNSTFSVPYVHPPVAPEGPGDGNSTSRKPRLTAVLLTGMEASAQRLDHKLYLNIAKMAYCKRHGYKFLTLTSNQFRPYFEPHTFEGVSGQANGGEYFQGFMAKVPMIVTAMMQNPEHEWVLWTDDDVYIHPGWMYLPLDEFLGLDRVPANKTFVSSNYRSAFTNIFAIRNNEQGRRLAIDWLAVTQSGYVECHGFDQAALQTLILARIAGAQAGAGGQRSDGMDNPFPFNHTCLYSDAGDTGCNSKGRWSCDFQFEKSLYFAGFKTAINNNFFELRLSSYSKGCANGVIPDFHVIAETSTTPRFQAGHATRLWEIYSSGHWDGPLGGGNDKFRRGAVNGWFTSHKAEFLFWESYLDPLNCKGVPNAVPPCEFGVAQSHSPIHQRRAGAPRGRSSGSHGSHIRTHPHVSALVKEEHDSTAYNNQQHAAYDLGIVSLVDGYGFDLLKGEYCRVLDPLVLRHQREHTYMRDYPALIAAGNKYSQHKWDMSYRNFSGGEGRAPCHGTTKDCDHGEGPDGQKQKEAIKPDNEKEFFERPDYCETCLRVKRPDGIVVVDCRLDAEILSDKQRNVSYVDDPDDLRKEVLVKG